MAGEDGPPGLDTCRYSSTHLDDDVTTAPMAPLLLMVAPFRVKPIVTVSVLGPKNVCCWHLEITYFEHLY